MPKRERRTIVARASARVDLAGGSLDLWPVGLIVGGACTVNVAVSLRATVELLRTDRPGLRLVSEDLGADYLWKPGRAPGPLPLVERFCQAFGLSEGWEVAARSDVPPGSGLGGSSALSVALLLALGACTGRTMEKAGAAAFCRDLEAVNLGIPTGVQDFWPALAGGVLCIRYEPGGEAVERIPVSLADLKTRLLVAYSGQSRVSARTNWELIKRCLNGDPKTRGHLAGVAAAASELRERLCAGDLDGAGPLLTREWEHRRQLARGISTPRVERLLRAAREAGASGGKACGAGGGGCLAFWVPQGARWKVAQALEREGAAVLEARPVSRGHSLEVVP